MKKAFIDISKFDSNDWANLKQIMIDYDITLNQALWVYMDKCPDRLRVVGEIENGKVRRDEINENGVSEFNGEEAFLRMVKDVLKDKEEK